MSKTMVVSTLGCRGMKYPPTYERTSHMAVQTDGGRDSAASTLPYNDLELVETAVQTTVGPRLQGQTCRDCGQNMLGRRYVCSGCMSSELDQSLFGPFGSLYSYTVVRVSPKFAEAQLMGYVDLDEGVRLLALISADPDVLRCDLPVELVIGSDWYFKTSETKSAAETDD
ncbi:OB-fold domain-containing protein [Cryobacterium sp. TMT1-66-1]|nr:OB-fold domain-containing protein [Cryobacterium sp. TMT1-66-1]